MQVTAESRDSFTILHLQGEVDTCFCPLLEKEIDDLLRAGVVRIVLNLEQVKFINSNALKVIIKTSRQLEDRNGKLVIARPSAFCRGILHEVGMDQIIPIFDNAEEAEASVVGA
jgi:anti-anti-sigma factor